MSSLQNKLIRDSYDGLIKTNDEDAITATPKTLQDGAGNNLPVQVGTNGMVYSGTQDFTGATVLGISGGGGGLENYQYYPYTVYTSGYGATYARTSQPLNGGPFWQAAIDQNANTAILSQLFLEAGREITNLITPFLSVVDNDTYTFAIYDTYATGSPKDIVFTTTIPVSGAAGDQYVDTAISFTPTGNRYWFALQTATSGASKIGMFSRDAFANNRFTYGAWGSSPVGMLAINSLYYNSGTLPATFASDQSFGHRDEGAVILYKTAATPI